MASPIRLSPDLLESAEQEGAIQRRSVPKQIELWAELGRAVSGVIDIGDVFAVLQGLKTLKLNILRNSGKSLEIKTLKLFTTNAITTTKKPS